MQKPDEPDAAHAIEDEHLARALAGLVNDRWIDDFIGRLNQTLECLRRKR